MATSAQQGDAVESNMPTSGEPTPLHDAARAGDLARVKALLEAAAPPALDARDKLRRTALHLAAWAGHTDVCQALLDAKCIVDATASDLMTALHFASQGGHVAVVRALLDAGANHSPCDLKKHMTPLHYAAQRGHGLVVTALLSRGADGSVRSKRNELAGDLAKTPEVRKVPAPAPHFVAFSHGMCGRFGARHHRAAPPPRCC